MSRDPGAQLRQGGRADRVVHAGEAIDQIGDLVGG